MHTFSIWLGFLSVAGGGLSAAPQRREAQNKKTDSREGAKKSIIIKE